MLNYTFGWGSDGMSYADNLFRNTNAGSYAQADISEGAISVVLGGVDTLSSGAMSGGWSVSVNLLTEMTGTVTFDYQIVCSGPSEPDEYGEALFSLDGQLIGQNGNDYLERVIPEVANTEVATEWTTVTLDLGTMTAGMHVLSLGGYMAGKTYVNETTVVSFDNFSFDVSTPQVVNTDPEPVPDASTVLMTFEDDVLKFGNVADNVGGGLGNDKLTGAGGNDMLFGDEGADILTGGNHNDTLVGGSGQDVLRGGNGDDILWGGEGNDILHGDAASGGGADIFCFSGNSWGGFDIIKDFDASEGDKLDLSHLVEGYVTGVSQVKHFVKLQDLGLRTLVRVDIDGFGGDPGFAKVAVLHGVTGLGTAQDLFDNDILIL